MSPRFEAIPGIEEADLYDFTKQGAGVPKIGVVTPSSNGHNSDESNHLTCNVTRPRAVLP